MLDWRESQKSNNNIDYMIENKSYLNYSFVLKPVTDWKYWVRSTKNAKEDK
jgi:hypothetical protein